MSDFDINHFEDGVEALLQAYARLRDDYQALRTAHEAENERNRETRDRLKNVIERIRALETEADNA